MNQARNRKLAIVIPSAYLSGGVQTWLDYVIPGLADKDWGVTVMTVQGHLHNAHKYLELHPFEKVRLVKNPTGSREGRVRSLMHALKSIQPDLVMSVNIVDVYEAVSRLRQNGFVGIRVAMALHGFNSEFFQDIKVLNRLLDGVITTNRLGVAAAAAIGGMDRSRIHYASCGVNIGALPNIVTTPGPITLLYSGRFFQREKRIFDLPKILKSLDERGVSFRFRLAGSGPNEMELRAALSCFGDRVEFLGQLDEQTLRTTFYQPGAILLITSPSESGPLVAWEAMAHGVSVVTSNYLGIGLEGSLLDGENCMTFPVADAEAAANAIVRLQDVALRARLVYQGYELVRHKYSREASIKAWDSALQNMLETPPKASAAFTVAQSATGRLDRYLGVALAETLRRVLRVSFKHKDPGGEWPHTYSVSGGSMISDALQALDHGEVYKRGQVYE